MPGVVGMAQSLELPGVEGMVQTPDLGALGPYGNLQFEDWRCQGLGAWRSRRNFQGSDRRKTRTPRTRIEEDEEWGYGLTVPRSETLTTRGVCETLASPHQVRLKAGARPRCSPRRLSPFETAFEPAFEPPRATSSESSSEWKAIACAGNAPTRGSGPRASSD